MGEEGISSQFEATVFVNRTGSETRDAAEKEDVKKKLEG
jgi:hypothetical protein